MKFNELSHSIYSHNFRHTEFSKTNMNGISRIEQVDVETDSQIS